VRLRTTATALLACTATLLVAPPAATAASAADQVRDRQWHHRFLNTAAAHRISQGEGVTVAVIDSGVDPHRDLRNNLLRGTDVVKGGTGDGRADTNGHGTAMASLIAAHGRGASGVLGLAPRARVLPVRCEVSRSDNGADELAKGIRWAIARNAKVISISWGGSSSVELLEAVNEAEAADVVIIAAAGNKPEDSIGVIYPAAFRGVVAVTATDRSGEAASVSVKGREVILSAPGTDILSAGIENGYRRGTGTSPATAIVAGAAALVRSKYPELSAKEVIHRLTATAIDKGPKGRDDQYGYGVLNLVGALTATVPPLDGAQPSASTSAASPRSPSTAAAQPGSSAAPGQAGGRETGSGSSLGIVVTIGAIAIVGLLAAAFVAMVHRRRRHTNGIP